ncbi:LPS export ABC transporter periplasmic protein LptC [Methylophaga sp. OBS4]|uniref:LPS export ABC transporter periplasmic protein LptC n=1 Tax=Methylophaga sp. OBS4 TaxID=2991935 RepID=UPI0022532057|nr:LPS export ABC transporter periplasmic protein LptC [Methylophaga sp. OBS4]MCX4187447.1 LPS export ABC transporter periplasmic protein LptC [Methylophaga sp. OBS4]
MNAIFNIPFYAKLALFAVALLSLWLIIDDSDPSGKTLREIHRTSDYAMTDFTMTVMDANGVPSRIIQGEEIAHFPHDDSTEIIQPIAEFMQPGNDTWIIQSEHGHTQGKGENILLTGNVIITNKDNPEFKLLTEKLTLDTVYNTAYTDEAVTIHSPHGDTHSVGLHAALEDETINLHSKVRGQYDAPAN